MMAGPRLRAPRQALLALPLVACLLSGCWDRVEINNLSVIVGAAVDAAPHGELRLTLQLILPAGIRSPGAGGGGGGGGGGGPKVAVVRGTGRSIAGAVAKIQEEVPGRIFWGDVRAVVVGQALARRGIGPVIDFFLRNRLAWLNTDLLVTRGEAGPLLRVAPPFRSLPVDNLYEVLRRGVGGRAPLYRFATRMLETGAGFIVPVVEAAHLGAGGSGAGGSGAEVPEVLRLSGGAVFSGSHLVGWLSPQDLRGALWLNKRAERGTVTLRYRGATVTMKLQRARVQRKVVQGRHGAEILIGIQAEDSLVGVNGGASLHLSKPATLAALSRLLGQRIRERAVGALAVARSLGTDPFGFGRLLAAERPRLWRRIHAHWGREFRTFPVVIQVYAHARFTGNLVDPLGAAP